MDGLERRRIKAALGDGCVGHLIDLIERIEFDQFVEGGFFKTSASLAAI